MRNPLSAPRVPKGLSSQVDREELGLAATRGVLQQRAQRKVFGTFRCLGVFFSGGRGSVCVSFWGLGSKFPKRVLAGFGLEA